MLPPRRVVGAARKPHHGIGRVAQAWRRRRHGYGYGHRTMPPGSHCRLTSGRVGALAVATGVLLSPGSRPDGKARPQRAL